MHGLNLPTTPLREGEAYLNITVNRQNGTLVDPIPFDLSDEDIKVAAREIMLTGMDGVDPDPTVDFDDYIVQRYEANETRESALLMLRPKTPYGNPWE